MTLDPTLDPTHERNDATADDLSHDVGCSCSHCAAIRRTGPKPPRNPLARLIAASTAVEAGDSEADNRRHEMRMRRRRATRGVRGLLAAIKGASKTE